MPKEVWLTTIEAAELEGVSRKTGLIKATSGQWQSRIDLTPSRGGNAGKRYLVALSSLSTLAQKRWHDIRQEELLNPDIACTTEAAVNKADKPAKVRNTEANLAEVKAMVGGKRFDEMMQEADQKAAAVKEYLALDDGPGKSYKAREIAERYGVSASALYRWVDDYKQGGTAALIRKLPSLGVGTVRRAVSDDLEQLIIAEYLQLNKPKAAHVHRKAEKYCALNGIKNPSRATVYRVIEELEKTQPDLVCLGRCGEEEYVKKFAEKILRKDPEFINQVWMGDHHRMDAFIVYQGRAVRPWVTTWIDVCSRTIVGWTMAIQANGRTIGLALRHGIMSKHMPVWDGPISAAMSRATSALGWDSDILEQNAGIVSPINGLPGLLYIDNGEDYKSKVKKGLKCEGFGYSREVRSTCEILDIKTQFALPYSPWAKGHMERWYGTMTDQFSRYLPGYCGKDNKARPAGLDEQAMAERGELLDIEELAALFETYLDVYHNTVHSSLGMTPLQKYEQTPKVREGIPDERTLDICLMDMEKAKVYASGIQRFGTGSRRRYYSHPELDKYTGRWVVIRFDPNRIGELLVFNPANGQYVCTATNRELLAFDATQDDISKHMRKRATRKKEVKESLRTMKDNTLEASIARRQAGGPVMVSGATKAQDGTRYITGLEGAAKRTNQDRGPRPVGAAAKKAADKPNRFEEYILAAGNFES
ncbi:MAG TPA: Mu transposase C-terminal domain-containing protein [Syntrophomonadaceae bacterium]|nr:Mu transposase C-terminal domain-containing protein [Syntrophomonadaceae bacterium]